MKGGGGAAFRVAPLLVLLLLLLLTTALPPAPLAHAWTPPPPDATAAATANTGTGSATGSTTITRRAAWHRSGGRILTGAAGAAAAALPSPTASQAVEAAAAASSTALEARLTGTVLTQRRQPLSSVNSSLSSASALALGVDAVAYPPWLRGTWRVTQTLVAVATPLGLAYAGGPGGVASIAAASVAEAERRLGRPVRLQLRYVETLTKGGGGAAVAVVVEDRLYNTRQRLDRFAGQSVVASVEYADTRGSNRAAVLKLTPGGGGTRTVQAAAAAAADEGGVGGAAGGGGAVPRTTTMTYFKGPAAQKTFVTSHHPYDHHMYGVTATAADSEAALALSCAAASGAPWTGFECQRSLFALTNASTAPPITTDTELIFQFQRASECRDNDPNHNHNDHVTGKLRIAGYLNPNDKLYFDARNRAVTLQDYTLDMIRI